MARKEKPSSRPASGKKKKTSAKNLSPKSKPKIQPPDSLDPQSPSRGERQQARKQQEQAQHKKARQKIKKRVDEKQVQMQAQRQAIQAQQHVDAEAKMMQMPILNVHAAGIDVGDRSHWVCVGPNPNTDIREFPSHTQGLKELVAWLRHCGVTHAALEASGAYGTVLFLTLIEEGIQAITTPPQFARQIKGRPKTDKRDCQWIWRLHALGMLPSIFQPDEPTHTLRDYLRQRGNLVREGSEQIQRMQKALQNMNLKLTNVLDDITGTTGLKIVEAILKGERDPKKLARLRDYRCKESAEVIARALEGRYRPEHLMELEVSYQLWKNYQQVIAKVDQAIEGHLGKMRPANAELLDPLPETKKVKSKGAPPFDVRKALYLVLGLDLTQIEGINEGTALTLVSELGMDYSKWPTVKHFTSWLGLCPNWQKTGGKVKSSRTRKGKNRAATALWMAAFSLLRSQGYLGAQLRNKRAKLGAPKAITAMAHKLARILYNMMRHGIAYLERTEQEYQEEQRAKREKNLQRNAKQLGFRLVKIEEESAETPATAPE